MKDQKAVKIAIYAMEAEINNINESGNFWNDIESNNKPAPGFKYSINSIKKAIKFLKK
tara:strand:- start:308 stop:481 length:174 start_codon:yes stop_codon:yes gene_type:complete